MGRRWRRTCATDTCLRSALRSRYAGGRGVFVCACVRRSVDVLPHRQVLRGSGKFVDDIATATHMGAFSAPACRARCRSTRANGVIVWCVAAEQMPVAAFGEVFVVARELAENYCHFNSVPGGGAARASSGLLLPLRLRLLLCPCPHVHPCSTMMTSRAPRNGRARRWIATPRTPASTRTRESSSSTGKRRIPCSTPPRTSSSGRARCTTTFACIG